MRAGSREAYFDTGLAVLADVGYGGLKLGEVCTRLGVTTGSFYHFFSSWSVYTRELITYWRDAHTLRLVEAATAQADPRKRFRDLMRASSLLPHRAEAAIRSWSLVDPQVRAVQVEVDQQRYDILNRSACEVLADERAAARLARWAVYLLVGYEQATLAPDAEALSWIVRQLLDALDSGRSAAANKIGG